jgi:predicted dehydrogenase
MTAQKVAWIGLGKVAAHHLEALEYLSDVARPVAGCDPNDAIRMRYSDKLPMYISIPAMLAEHRPDVVVIASPTPTHAEVCDELLAVAAVHKPRLILVEKPLATTPGDVKRLLAAARKIDVDLRGIYHAAYAPEVEWGLGVLSSIDAPLLRVESEFLDPYVTSDPDRRSRVYGDSWLDSGINALSVLSRIFMIHDINVRCIPDLTSTYAARLAGARDNDPRDGHIYTSWQAVEAAKSTRLYFQDGSQVLLNHQATAAQVYGSSGLLAAWGADGATARLTSHYIGALAAALDPAQTPLDDVALLTLLLEGRG